MGRSPFARTDYSSAEAIAPSHSEEGVRPQSSPVLSLSPRTNMIQGLFCLHGTISTARKGDMI